MTEILLHAETEKQISSLTALLPAALLVAGERGSGLGTLVHKLAGDNLEYTVQPLLTTTSEIDEHNGTISVEIIRLLYERTRGKSNRKKIIIIDDADRMSPEAQAAFLKLLEEPPKNTHFILTSHSPQILLPTVRSRVQTITLRPITEQQSTKFLKKNGVADSLRQSQLLFIAGGRPAELARLIDNEEYFRNQAAIMTDAKVLLGRPSLERLLLAQKYNTSRGDARQLIDSAIRIVTRSLHSSPQPANVRQLDALLELRDRLLINTSPRLQLLRFVL